jgi:hypothetical protein
MTRNQIIARWIMFILLRAAIAATIIVLAFRA